MSQKKVCFICRKVPADFSNSFYCFSCDSLFCPACIMRNVKMYETEWVCPKCKAHNPLDEARIIKKDE